MDNKKVIVRETPKHGKGIFAIKKIKKDEIIAEFDGAIYDRDNTNWDDDSIYNYVIQFEKWRWKGSKGIAKLSNHSCDPNCGIKDLFKIVAMRDIVPGEEITWDYEMTENHTWSMKCSCGSPLCRKKINAYKNMPLATRKKYQGYISEWLTKSAK
jgi:SET domain-containing protein